MLVLDKSFVRPFSNIWESDLLAAGIKHSCGKDYKVGFLDNGTGDVFTHRQDLDVYEAIVTARCINCHGPGADSSYNYARINWSGTVLLAAVSPEKLIVSELQHVWGELVRHLKQLQATGYVVAPFLPSPGLSHRAVVFADLAERLTQLLVKNRVVLSKAAELLETQEDALLKLAERMGFVADSRWRVMDMTDRDNSWVAEAPSGPEFPVMFGTTKLDALLGLPPEHPMALAA